MVRNAEQKLEEAFQNLLNVADEIEEHNKAIKVGMKVFIHIPDMLHYKEKESIVVDYQREGMKYGLRNRESDNGSNTKTEIGREVFRKPESTRTQSPVENTPK